MGGNIEGNLQISLDDEAALKNGLNLKLKYLHSLFPGEGNASILGEFNFHLDPEAAFIVLAEYSCNIVLTPWEVSKRAELGVI